MKAKLAQSERARPLQVNRDAFLRKENKDAAESFAPASDAKPVGDVARAIERVHVAKAHVEGLTVNARIIADRLFGSLDSDDAERLMHEGPGEIDGLSSALDRLSAALSDLTSELDRFNRL